MPTTGNPNSTLVKIRIGATPVAIAKLTDASLSVNGDMRDVSSKDSPGWKEILPGQNSFSLSGGGLVDYGAAAGANHSALLAAITGKSVLKWEFGSGVTGDPKYSGDCYVTQWESASPSQEDNTTFQFSLEGTGALTVGTYA